MPAVIPALLVSCAIQAAVAPPVQNTSTPADENDAPEVPAAFAKARSREDTKS